MMLLLVMLMMLLVLLLLLELLQLELLPLELLELLVDDLILLRQVTGVHTGHATHHGIHTGHGHAGHEWHSTKGHSTRSHGSRHQLLLFLELGRTMAAHAKGQAGIITKEEFVVVGSHFRATGDSSKAPAVELASKRSKLGSLEVLWKHCSSKLLLLVDDEGSPVRQPGDGIRVFLTR
jgi:hypothetical protein